MLPSCGVMWILWLGLVQGLREMRQTGYGLGARLI